MSVVSNIIVSHYVETLQVQPCFSFRFIIKHNNKSQTGISDNLPKRNLCKLWVGMQTTVATLLFVTSSVILACVVVDYAVQACEQTLDTESLPQFDRIRTLEDKLLNQTDTLINDVESLNQTYIETTDQTTP